MQQWYQCDSNSGKDKGFRIGSCIETNCSSCATCVKAVSSYVMSQQEVSSRTEVAANFLKQYSNISAGLKGLAFTRANADTVAAAINSSHAGNIGRKAGGLCMQMQCECDASGQLHLCLLTAFMLTSLCHNMFSEHGTSCGS
jgi:hypothetical protein